MPRPTRRTSQVSRTLLTMRFFAYVLLAAAALVGCGETAAPTIPVDAGRDAAIDLDAGVDAAVEDGGADASIPDGGILDGGLPWCETSALCPTCPAIDSLCDDAKPCAIGEVCVATGCEDFARCFTTGGGACQGDEDCANPAYTCDQTIGRCLRIEPGCEDSSDCLAGFACESEICVDRRVPCEFGSDCPHGFTCFFPSPDQRFCRRISRPCDDDLDCLTLGVPCGDADGDGRKECMPSLTPNTPGAVSCDATQCLDPEAPVCETSVDGAGATCGRFGLCASAIDCAEGFQCRDLWGDGRAECVEGDGTCMDSSVCAPGQVCGTSRLGGPPTCIGGAVM